MSLGMGQIRFRRRPARRTRPAHALVVAWSLMMGLPAAAGAAAASWQVGVARVDITPDEPVRLNGFDNRHLPAEDVRQRLFAKALALGTGEEDVVLILTVDTLGIPDDLTERISRRLAAHGIDRPRLAICATHTHGAPMLRNCANMLTIEAIPDDQWRAILRYSDALEAKLERVAVEALAARRPAQVSHGVGSVGFAMNRRTPGGPVDHDLPVLAIRALDGSLQAVFTSYACHCVTLSDNLVSGDWAGYAMESLEARNPGCTALIAIGCGADANPRGASRDPRPRPPRRSGTNSPRPCRACSTAP